MPTEPDKSFQWKSLARSLRYLGAYPHFLLASFSMLFLVMGIDLALPWLIGYDTTVLKNAVLHGTPVNPWKLAGVFIALCLVRDFLRFNLGPTRNRLVQNVLKDIRTDFFSSLQRQGFPYHSRSNTGDLISRATGDIGKLQGFFFACLFLGIDIFVSMFATLILMFLIHPWLGILLICTTLPTVTLIAWFSRKLGPKWWEVHSLHGKMVTVIQENVAGVRVVKAFARESDEIKKFNVRRDDVLQKSISVIDEWSSRVPLAQFIYGLTMPLALGVGGYLVIHGNMEVGLLSTVVFYVMGINHRMGAIGRFLNVMQEASAGASRVFEIIQAPHEMKNGTRALPPGKGSVSFEDVTFDYTPERAALSHVSFTVPSGQCVAIVGPTGSGKTTLVNMIPRFYDTSSGVVRVEGVDVRELNLPELRRSIGVIFQETFLFSATIAENIAYGRPGAPLDRIIASAKAAQAHDFIEQLPNGYDTIIGERGVSLSGGQKQRIALARAFLLDPRILILDDATASVDARTEQHIQQSIRTLCAGRTVFIIAHRLSSVTFADRILVLDEGKLVEEGTHEELMSRDGFYRKLIHGQMQHDLIPELP